MYYKFHCGVCDSHSIVELEDDGSVICPYCDTQYEVRISGDHARPISIIGSVCTKECRMCEYYLDTSEISKGCCMLEHVSLGAYSRLHCDKQSVLDNLSPSLNSIPDIIYDDYIINIVCKTLEQVEILLSKLAKIYISNRITYNFDGFKSFSEPKMTTPYQFSIVIKKGGKHVEFSRAYGVFEISTNTLSYYSVFYHLSGLVF